MLDGEDGLKEFQTEESLKNGISDVSPSRAECFLMDPLSSISYAVAPGTPSRSHGAGEELEDETRRHAT